MIPKIIHYIWLGGNKYPGVVKECLESWTQHLPHYEIIRWDESNIPKDILFVKHMLKKKQWAFASDCLRFWVLYHHGGVYLDTDMKILQDFDFLIRGDKLFFGKEKSDIMNGAIIGCEKNDLIIQDCLSEYLNYSTENEIENLILKDLIIPKLITRKLNRICPIDVLNNYQKNNFFTVYPTQTFYPVPFKNRNTIGDFQPGDNNYTIHLWDASWHDEFQNIIHKKYKKSFGIFIRKLISNKVTPKHFIRYWKRLISTYLGL